MSKLLLNTISSYKSVRLFSTSTKIHIKHIPVTIQQKENFQQNGFCKVDNVLCTSNIEALKSRFEPLFRGEFESGIYPDEWHWREGISKENAFREIVNAWKSDPLIKELVTHPELGKFASTLMNWKTGAQLAQDDILWKPAQSGHVAYHQDGAYIAEQFVPTLNNSLTIWIALDDANHDTGVVEYAKGSHKWTIKSGNANTSSFHGEGDYQEPLRQAAKSCNVVDVEIEHLPIKAGSAIVHHQNVWHGSGMNKTTTQPRRAIGIHLIAHGLSWRTSPPPDYIYGRYCVPQYDNGFPSEAFFPIVWQP